MKHMRWLIWVLAVTVVLGTTVAAQAAYEFYMTVEGVKQGKLKGENQPFPGAIGCLGFQFQVEAPRDVATGQASGKRQYSPLTITTEWGPSSPQLFQALISNEAIKTVECQFFSSTPTGTQQPYATIRLTNAVVSKVQYRLETSSQGLGPPGALLEDISFTFQKIELQSQGGLTTSMDQVTALGAAIMLPLVITR